MSTLTIEQINKINAKAVDKKDGVYSFLGNKLKIKNGKLKAYMTGAGEIYENHGHFSVQIGSFNPYSADEKKESTCNLKIFII